MDVAGAEAKRRRSRKPSLVLPSLVRPPPAEISAEAEAALVESAIERTLATLARGRECKHASMEELLSAFLAEEADSIDVHLSQVPRVTVAVDRTNAHGPRPPPIRIASRDTP